MADKTLSPINQAELQDLEKKFLTVCLVLTGFILVSLASSVRVVQFPPANWLVLICSMTGFCGSSVAALISALNRHANGFEDSNGNQYPEPDTKKERFSKGMYYWFVFRPLLGLVTGALVYYGAVAGFFGSTLSKTGSEGLAFLGLLAGLFAKTLLDILKNAMKGMFGLKRD